jgi:FtsH-binding integral membrane protein
MYTTTSVTQTEYDLGLRNYLLSVFNYMTTALLISGVISAYIGYNTVLATAIWASPLKWVALLAPLIIALGMSFMANKISTQTAKIMLFLFAAAMGVSISSIFLVYKLGSIVQVFFITGATFGSMALYGYTTKRDLSKIGSFLIMGVIGVVIVGLVNLFLQSSMLSTVISLVSVVIFTGLTAYDMQNIKAIYYETSGDEREKAGVFGALSLYMDFVNIFISLMNLLGQKKD